MTPLAGAWNPVCVITENARPPRSPVADPWTWWDRSDTSMCPLIYLNMEHPR